LLALLDPIQAIKQMQVNPMLSSVKLTTQQSTYLLLPVAQGGFVINGENVDDSSGVSVSNAGDTLAVNDKAPCATSNGREVNCYAVFFTEDDIGFSSTVMAWMI
jgi:hypothetical protein